jgi:hypothetical protein
MPWKVPDYEVTGSCEKKMMSSIDLRVLRHTNQSQLKNENQVK